ncbi:hypothetical protein NDU88_001442 [Pleurodeles waltl]|uniref:Uncharacterized protein n=1 Tax=Pleurodeles waltl TaxID=8319 RepID=A0AAV7MNR4_PLEWA|nr:hypothetical protein NDU88_001442 [Pleurodeles waltl]
MEGSDEHNMLGDKEGEAAGHDRVTSSPLREKGSWLGAKESMDKKTDPTGEEEGSDDKCAGAEHAVLIRLRVHVQW